MSNPQLSEKEVTEAVYTFAAEQMKQGLSGPQIEQKLVALGLDGVSAAVVVQGLTQAWSKAVRTAGLKDILFGALWCIGGIVVTAATYGAASPGGSYVIAWGAILFGAIQCCRGMFRALIGR